MLWNAVVEDAGHQDDCRFLADHRAYAGARGDVKRQVPTSTTSAHDDALSVDARKLAKVLDNSETVFNGVGGLKIDVTTPIRWRDEDLAGCQEARAGGEIAVASRRVSGTVAMPP